MRVQLKKYVIRCVNSSKGIGMRVTVKSTDLSTAIQEARDYIGGLYLDRVCSGFEYIPIPELSGVVIGYGYM